MTETMQMIREEIRSKEDLTLRLGDALDVKASIGLAVILFLATQSAYFLDKGLPAFGMALQLFSISFTVVAAVFALLELWPRTYILPDPESDYIHNRIDALAKHYGSRHNAETHIAETFTRENIEWAKQRIADSQKKNRSKSFRLEFSFWFTGGAVILNLLTVLLFLKKIF